MCMKNKCFLKIMQELLASFAAGFTCPPKPHIFVVMPLQTTCVHNVIGYCAICVGNSRIPTAATIAACTHNWSAFKDASLKGVACDFSLPSHLLLSDPNSAVHYCTSCFAMVCNGCFTG